MHHSLTFAGLLRILAILSAMQITSASLNAEKPSAKGSPSPSVAGDNPLLVESTLPYHAPPFDKIKDEHFVPAIEAGMREELKEVDAIAGNSEKPSFDNTIVALERTGLSGSDISRFVHGTTLATNVLLERRGARTALAVTQGFGDILRLARESRVGALRYDLLFPPPDPAIERELTFEVRERMTASGEVHIELEPAEIDRVVTAIAAQQPEAIAISFLHSYTNPGTRTRTLARARDWYMSGES